MKKSGMHIDVINGEKVIELYYQNKVFEVVNMDDFMKLNY